MGSNPINLAVRFILELSALVALGRWGWFQGEGLFRYLLALGVIVLAAGLWGAFNVPGDPSRSGRAPVAVPGYARLLLELAFFGAATWALFATGLPGLGWAFGLVTLIHYLLSYDRIAWLLRQGGAA